MFNNKYHSQQSTTESTTRTITMPIYQGVTKHLSAQFDNEQSVSQSLLSPAYVQLPPTRTSPVSVTNMSTQQLGTVLQISPESNTNINVPENPCSLRGCKFRHSHDHIRICASHKFGCPRFIHSYCYGNFLAKNDLEALVDTEDDITYCVCSKRCYNKVKNALANNTYYSPDDVAKLGWENDGRNGTSDINNSMKLLLDWMGENGAANYTRFRGKNNILSKQQTAELVAQRINSFGVKVTRTAKSVLNKLYYLEKSFRTAHDFANSETGAGLLSTDNVATFQKLIEKRCIYYNELLPIFEGRASVRATITSNDLDNDTDDEDDSDDDYDDGRNYDDNEGGNGFSIPGKKTMKVRWQRRFSLLQFVPIHQVLGAQILVLKILCQWMLKLIKMVKILLLKSQLMTMHLKRQP
jgi:hypothetical protein